MVRMFPSGSSYSLACSLAYILSRREAHKEARRTWECKTSECRTGTSTLRVSPSREPLSNTEQLERYAACPQTLATGTWTGAARTRGGRRSGMYPFSRRAASRIAVSLRLRARTALGCPFDGSRRRSTHPRTTQSSRIYGPRRRPLMLLRCHLLSWCASLRHRTRALAHSGVCAARQLGAAAWLDGPLVRRHAIAAEKAGGPA